MKHSVLVLLAVYCLNPGTFARAAEEKPAISRLFPAGGQRGTEVEIQLTGKPGDGALQVWTEHGELAFKVAEKGDRMTVTIPADAQIGVHWLRFYNRFGAAAMKPFVAGVLPELIDREPNNRLSDAQPLESSCVVNGVLEKSGEVDVFSVPVKAGSTLVAAVEAHSILGSPMDPVLQVLNEQGTMLAHNDDDHGNDPLIALPIAEDGRYLVRIFAFPSSPNSTIQFAGADTYVYRLTITTEAVAEHTLPLAIQQGTTSTIQVSGWNIPESSAALSITAPEAEAPDSTGHQPAVDHLLLPTPPESPFVMPLAVDVVGHPSFSESDLAPDSGDLTPPFSISGTIREARQRDTFWFAGKKGAKIRCQVIARARYSLLDPVLTVRSEDGRALKDADDIGRDNPDALLDLTLPSDGRFQLEVRDRFDHAGDRFFYRLQCQEIAPDASLSVSEESFVMTADKPLEIPVTITRLDGFAAAIDVSISGLPEGLSCETVRSEKEGDSAKKVTLKISGSSSSDFNGPITISATIAESPKQSSDEKAAADAANAPGEDVQQSAPGRMWVAQQELSVPGFKTSKIWLTVLATEPAEPAAKPE